MEAFIIDPARLISDIVGYITELKNIHQTSQRAITDDETTLHKFCVKLETVMRHEQKERYSLLGARKDYWNFISDCIPKDDGIRFVHAVPQVKTPQGKGRAFIRYSLVKRSLADAIQRCLVMRKHLSSCYGPEAILCHPSLSTALINKLYDLNDIEFDLPCGGHELDISWPAFSRRSFDESQGSVSGRRSSISSLTSVDLRNERPDPLVGLSSEVASLKSIFVAENSHELADNLESGSNDTNNTDSMSAEPPTITGMTLEISHLHQAILKWKSEQESQLSKAYNEAKKAQDERKFLSQEYELKNKQLNEKYSTLMKGMTEDAHTKVQELSSKLSKAENALSERDREIEMLKEEVKVSIGSSHEAQRSAIELERQLTTSERKQTELSSACEQFKERLKHKEEITLELETKLKELKGKCYKYESSKVVSNNKVAELEGELKAKAVVLERVQESFEKLNGMVFGSFEELETELKTRLVERERGLENQSAENRRLETNMVEIQQQNRELNNQLADAKTKAEEMENSNNDLQSVVEDLKLQLSSQQEQEERFLSELNEVLQSHEGTRSNEENGYAGEQNDYEDQTDGHGAKGFSKGVLKQVTHLVSEMSSLRHMLHEKSAQKEQLEEHVAELQGSIERKTCQIRCLNEEVDSSRKRIEFINEEKELLEMEKIETDSKITALKESELSLNSNISLIVEEKCKALNELTLLKSRKADEEKLRLSAQEELAALKEQLEETVESKYKLEKELASITATLQTMDSEKRYLDDQVKTLEEKMLACQDERIGLEDELDVARQQLEAANEARIRAEQGQVKAQEQLESLRCMMDQEIAALKFQLSSETMKYETELKSLSDQIQEYNSVKERLTEQQEVIVDLESKLKERNDTLQHDKHKYVSEIKHLRNEVQQFKSGFDENKLRIRALENELLLTSKQLEEERSRQREMRRKVDEFEEAKGLKDQEYESKIKAVKGDVEELKSRLVEVTKEKAELWQKADAMEHEIKVKADDRWMDDSEASHCLGCHAEFTFLLRKHHCRMCGRIFCYNCSDNWIQTPHSRKLRRVCRQCFSFDQRLKVKHAGVSQCIEDDARSDTSDRLSERTVSFLSDTGGVDAEEGPSTTQPADCRVFDSDSLNMLQSCCLPLGPHGPATDDRLSLGGFRLALTQERHCSPSSNTLSPSTSRSSHPDPPQSSSTPVKPSMNNTGENEIGDSETDRTGVKENSLNSPNTTKNVTDSKNSDEESDRSSPEVEQREECEEYEIVDTSNGEYACEQPGAQIVLSESDSREELVIPSVNEEPGAFWHVTVSPGKRHLIQVMVGTPRASLSWKFSTEKKSIRFGVAFKKSERTTDDESKTVVPLSQYNSHERAVKGEIQDSTPGVYLLVFDNTFSRFTSKRLFCMVQVTRSDNNEDDDDSLT